MTFVERLALIAGVTFIAVVTLRAFGTSLHLPSWTAGMVFAMTYVLTDYYLSKKRGKKFMELTSMKARDE